MAGTASEPCPQRAVMASSVSMRDSEGIRPLNHTSEWNERDDNITPALSQRTEELYRVPNREPDEQGLIDAPVLPLRDLVVFPRMVSPIFVGREASLLAIQEAQAEQRHGDRPGAARFRGGGSQARGLPDDRHRDGRGTAALDAGRVVERAGAGPAAA